MGLSDDVSKAVSHFMLDKVQPRVISFEEQVGIDKLQFQT